MEAEASGYLFEIDLELLLQIPESNWTIATGGQNKFSKSTYILDSVASVFHRGDTWQTQKRVVPWLALSKVKQPVSADENTVALLEGETLPSREMSQSAYMLLRLP